MTWLEAFWQMIVYAAIATVVFSVFCGWVVLCARATNGAAWGFIVALSPLFVAVFVRGVILIKGAAI